MEHQNRQVDDLRNEVLRRVGRNLLLFQQIELLMKFLVANVSMEVGPRGPTAKHTRRQGGIRKKGLSQIREQFFEEVYSEPIEREDDANITAVRVRSSFRISVTDADLLRRDEEMFEAMTAERNELVHHFLERCQLNDAASLAAALVQLDDQRERVLPLHQNLVLLRETVVEGLQATATFLHSPDGHAAIELMHLQSSRIVSLLAQVTQVIARPDGWTLLSSAGNFIAVKDPEQLQTINQRFGHRGLQSLVSAAEIFEVREELVANGAKHSIYRVKPGATELV